LQREHSIVRRVETASFLAARKWQNDAGGIADFMAKRLTGGENPQNFEGQKYIEPFASA
jgi:hypothetical protein